MVRLCARRGGVRAPSGRTAITGLMQRSKIRFLFDQLIGAQQKQFGDG